MSIFSEATLLDRWMEFSGGSRPGSNYIKFEEQNGEIVFHLKYVFDWETKETVHFTKKLSKQDFDYLVENLNQKGHAKIEKEDQTEGLIFEWKISEGRIQIRLELRNSTSLDGPGTYMLAEFRDLLTDEPAI